MWPNAADLLPTLGTILCHEQKATDRARKPTQFGCNTHPPPPLHTELYLHNKGTRLPRVWRSWQWDNRLKNIVLVQVRSTWHLPDQPPPPTPMSWISTLFAACISCPPAIFQTSSEIIWESILHDCAGGIWGVRISWWLDNSIFDHLVQSCNLSDHLVQSCDRFRSSRTVIQSSSIVSYSHSIVVDHLVQSCNYLRLSRAVMLSSPIITHSQAITSTVIQSSLIILKPPVFLSDHLVESCNHLRSSCTVMLAESRWVGNIAWLYEMIRNVCKSFWDDNMYEMIGIIAWPYEMIGDGRMTVCWRW